MSATFTNKFILDTYQGILHSDGELTEMGRSAIYDGSGNESAISIGRSCNGIEVCGDSQINGNLEVDTLSLSGKSFLDITYPIGSVYFTTINSSPTTLFGGVWIRVAEGRFIVGVGSGNDGIDIKSFPSGNAGGTYNHVLTTSQIPSHSHGIPSRPDASAVAYESVQMGPLGSTTTTTLSTGGGLAHENTPPAFGLYAWSRTE